MHDDARCDPAKEKEMKIYVLKGVDPEMASVEVYELDHETEKCLFFKVRSGIHRQLKKAWGFRWFRSEEEVTAQMKTWRENEIARLERRIERLRELKEISIHEIPAEFVKSAKVKLK
jgi:hypothetical protein